MSAIWITAIALTLRIFANPIGNVFQKQLTFQCGIHPLLINFLTYFGLSIALLAFFTQSDWTALSLDFWGSAVFVGILGAVGNGFLIKALQIGDLSILGPINAYKSVIGIIGGVLILGEIPSTKGLIGVCLIIFGSYFIFDTIENKFSWKIFKRKEILYRLLALVFTATEAVFLKRCISLSSPSIAFYAWCVFGAFFSFILLKTTKINLKTEKKKFQKQAIVKLILLIISLGTMQLTTNYVFNNMQVGYALSLFQLSIIISILFGKQFFQETNIIKKLLAGIIMIAGSILIIWS